MDPNETLKGMRLIAEHFLSDQPGYQGTPDGEPTMDDARELAELVQAIDGWLSRGGFLPDAWKR